MYNDNFDIYKFFEQNKYYYFEENDILKLELVDDILNMMENCRTEDDLRESLLKYFDNIQFEIID